MDLQIRKANPEDAEILIKIYNEAFYEDYVRYGECPAYGRSVDDMKKSMLRKTLTTIIIVSCLLKFSGWTSRPSRKLVKIIS